MDANRSGLQPWGEERSQEGEAFNPDLISAEN